MSNKPLIVLFLVFVGACAPTKPNYYWGDYEATLYQKYQTADSIPPDEELARLLLVVEKAQASGLKIGPGVNLHIAMLHAQAGRVDAARTFVRAEEALYPMSRDFTKSVFKKVKE
jgi:hypothetical protein